MKCQPMGCNNKAVWWQSFDDSNHVAVCQKCADKAVRFVDPEMRHLLVFRPLTKKVEKLLKEYAKI